MQLTILLVFTRRQINPKIFLPLLPSHDNGEPKIGILAQALANGVPCSSSAKTIELAVGALMDDKEHQISCRYAILFKKKTLNKKKRTGAEWMQSD